MSVAEAAVVMGVSYRHAKRLVKSFRENGVSALLHGNRDRAPWNKTEEWLRLRLVELSEGEYKEFNDSHFTQRLASDHGIEMCRETVRAIRRQEGISPKWKRRAPKHHGRRPRKENAGAMILWDGSVHRWFGKGKSPCCLMAAIDDATSTVSEMFLAEHECSWAYLKLLHGVITRKGIPLAVYQDRHSCLKRNDSFWSIDEELAGRQDPTQVGAALEALGIEPIFAWSPQAKGRVERLFKTLQDRLMAELDHEKIEDMDRANEYIRDVFLPSFNAQFSVEAADANKVWRKAPRGLDLDRILSLRYDRPVANDNAIRFDGMIIDIPPGPNGRSYSGVKAELRQLLDGSWRVYHNNRIVATAPASQIPEPIRTHNRRKGERAKRSEWVYMPASQPSQTPKTAGRVTAKRAGPSRTIGATRIA